MPLDTLPFIGHHVKKSHCIVRHDFKTIIEEKILKKIKIISDSDRVMSVYQIIYWTPALSSGQLLVKA